MNYSVPATKMLSRRSMTSHEQHAAQQLRADREHDLLLHGTASKHSSADKLVREVDLDALGYLLDALGLLDGDARERLRIRLEQARRGFVVLEALELDEGLAQVLVIALSDLREYLAEVHVQRNDLAHLRLLGSICAPLVDLRQFVRVRKSSLVVGLRERRAGKNVSNETRRLNLTKAVRVLRELGQNERRRLLE